MDPLRSSKEKTKRNSLQVARISPGRRETSLRPICFTHRSSRLVPKYYTTFTSKCQEESFRLRQGTSENL